MKNINWRKFKIFHIIALISTLSLSLTAAEFREVREITPPNLNGAYLGEQILCHRPMRNGVPMMTVDTQEDRIIAHNYGHGGSGWTLAPGCANHVNELFITAGKKIGLNESSPITIIGGGVLGFSTAYNLIQKGYDNITIIAESFENLTSHNAGGLLAPVSMNNEPEMQGLINKIGIDAYKFYADIANGKKEEFINCAKIIPTYFENREDSGLEPYVGQVMAPAKDVILDFKNGTTRKMVAYDDGIFIQTAIMMDQLRDYLTNKLVSFKQRKVYNLSEITGQFIINCSGLGGNDLNNDNEMVSVQGHLVMLKNQNVHDLEYMLLVYYPGQTITEEGYTITRSTYLFPKHIPGSDANNVGVLGGTFIEGATTETKHLAEFNIMIENAKNFYGTNQ